MKVCQLCGDVYKDHVDFCFNDGEILVADASLASPLLSQVELDPPMPRRVQGGQTATATAAPPATVPGAPWPEAAPVARPGVPSVPAGKGTRTPTPAVSRSTEITGPPEATPGAPDAVPIPNRTAGTPEPAGVRAVDRVEPTDEAPIDGLDDAVAADAEPAFARRPSDDPTETVEAPASSSPGVPTKAAAAALTLPPSAVPTPVTPEPRDTLRMAPSNDRPLGSPSSTAVTLVDANALRPAAGLAARTSTPLPATSSGQRTPSALPAQIRMGASRGETGGVLALEAPGERSNWLMIGAVFAVAAAFSTLGAGVVLAGMLYNGAPWEEPPATAPRTELPVPVTAPLPTEATSPEVPPLPAPVVATVPQPLGLPEPAVVAPDGVAPAPPVPAVAPAPENATGRPPGSAGATPQGTPPVRKEKVNLGTTGPATVTNVATGRILSEGVKVREASLEVGEYQLRYVQPGLAPVTVACKVPGENVAAGGVTDCTIETTGVAEPSVLPPPETRTAPIMVFGPDRARFFMDSKELGILPQKFELEIGEHWDCKLVLDDGTEHAVDPCTVPTPVDGDPKSSHMYLNRFVATP